jgi:predicted phosphodiesterase
VRYALFSDVHANLPALKAVLADIGRMPDRPVTYHLGDLVGYAPWPDETVAFIRMARIAGVAGNYDSTIGSGHRHSGSDHAETQQEILSNEGYAWTLAHTDVETRRYLSGLPFRVDLKPLGGHRGGPRVVLVHGTPTLNTLHWGADRSDDFSLRMATVAGVQAGDVICFGHTHTPWHREIEGIHFVNVGSAGRPKDGDWRAGYVVLDVGDGPVGVDFRRVEYDVAETMAGIRASGLPDEFAEFLRTGGTLGSTGE